MAAPNDEAISSTNSLTLTELPTEILFQIFSYISPKCVLCTISLICKKFRSLTSDDTYWRRRLTSYTKIYEYPECTLAVPNFRFAQACAVAELECEKWGRRREESMQFALLTSGHFASVDAVHLLKKSNLCISGSRDRNICVWNVNTHERALNSAAHRGWIWSIVSSDDDSSIFTGSWDQSVCEWSLGPTGLTQLHRMKCYTSVLCLATEYDVVAAGTFGSRVTLFDRRNRNQVLQNLTMHSRAVLGLATNEDYLYSCSEDKYVYCVDRRMWNVVCRTMLENYGVSMSLDCGQLWIGDSVGRCHMLDPRSESFSVLKTIEIVDKRRISDIHHNLGSVICLSADKKFRVFTNSLHSQPVSTFNLPSEPTKMSVANGSIACGFTDGTVGLWKFNTSFM